jgi:ParB family chromosome partitioning protein
MVNENIEKEQEYENETVFQEKEKRSVRNIELDKLFLGELNERLEPGDLEGLSASIKQVGVLEPLVVRPVGLNGQKFEIVAGGRRYRASKIAGITKVPCIVKELNDVDALQISFQENEERKSASPLEYGMLCWKLANRIGDLKEVADLLGKTESWVMSRINAYELYNKSKINIEEKGPNGDIVRNETGSNQSLGIVDSNMIMSAITSRQVNRYIAQQGENQEGLRTKLVRDISAEFPKLSPLQKKRLISEFKKDPRVPISGLTKKIIEEPSGIKVSISFNSEISKKIEKILFAEDKKIEMWIRELVKKEIERRESLLKSEA